MRGLDHLDGLSAKLTRLGQLRDIEIEAVRALPHRLVDVASAATLVREGDGITECCLLIDGFACRHKLARDGMRQIVSFHVAGDMLDIQHLMFDRADHNVQMITPGRVAFFPVDEVRHLVEDQPAVGRALWRDCMVDASIFREWVLNVGRRDAATRIAHMLCEFVLRCELAGLGSPDQLVLPLTQEHIADATGLTTVHVNRMLRQLRTDGALTGGGREYRVANWFRLRQIAGFSSEYLHAAA